MIDLPVDLRVKNRGGSDGAGLCVFASCKHASIWQHVLATELIFEFMFTKPGGGYPDKVDAVIDALSKKKGMAKPYYVQYEGRDMTLLKLACQTGRMPCVTYNYSPSGRYGGARIAHMVNLVHFDERWVAVLDNNFPGELEWIDTATFLRVWTGGGSGNGWAVVFVNPGPPPAPRNKKESFQ